MRLLLDTNIILDFFLERDPFYVESSQLFDAIAESNVEGFVDRQVSFRNRASPR